MAHHEMISAELKQPNDRSLIIVKGEPVQRCHTRRLARVVSISTSCYKLVDDAAPILNGFVFVALQMVASHGHFNQRCEAFVVLHVDKALHNLEPCSLLNDFLHDLKVAILRCKVQRCVLVSILEEEHLALRSRALYLLVTFDKGFCIAV